MTGTTQKLADFVSGARWDDVPENVRHEGMRSIVNWLGCAIGGCRDETVDVMIGTLRAFSGPEQATLLGRGERFDALTAALLNGTSSNRLDFDDTHLRTVIHPTVPIAAGLIALAEYRPMTGAEFLHAFILGVDVECRLGNAVSPEFYEQGWHITATTGVIGVAAACAKVMKLGAQRTNWAMGTAATQAGGLMETLGTMCKSFNMGVAARAGLMSALLAEKGFTSSPKIIEAPRGFLNVFARRYDEAEVTKDLGTKWEILENAYKPYPCGIVIHPVIDGCLDLRKAHGIDADAIAKIEATVNPLTVTLCGRKAPKDSLEGKLSVYHSAAVALRDGAAGVRQYLDDRVKAPEVIALRDKVEIKTDESIKPDQARVKVTLTAGKRYETFVEKARGSLERPLSDSELDVKFRALASTELEPSQIDKLAQACWSLAKLPDAAVLARDSVAH